MWVILCRRWQRTELRCAGQQLKNRLPNFARGDFGAGGSDLNRHLRDGLPANCRLFDSRVSRTEKYQSSESRFNFLSLVRLSEQKQL